MFTVFVHLAMQIDLKVLELKLKLTMGQEFESSQVDLV